MKGVANARLSRNAKIGRSGATLIVVPPGLVSQWDDERKKFTGDKLKCITIGNASTINKYSVNDFCNADIVICSAGILGEHQGSGKSKKHPYCDMLQTKSGSGKIPPPPSQIAQKEAPTIEGTWVSLIETLDWSNLVFFYVNLCISRFASLPSGTMYGFRSRNLCRQQREWEVPRSSCPLQFLLFGSGSHAS
jgi:hypothetical protein